MIFFGFHGIARYVQVAQAFGGWDKASKEHFADGAIYDQISQSIKRRFSFQ
jgi:ABC-type sulfate transport system substrate-binding protein